MDIGQAAISAGLTSSGILVTTAISIVSTFTLVSQALIGTVSLLRIIVVFASSILDKDRSPALTSKDKTRQGGNQT